MIGIYALSNADCENDIYVGSSKNIKKRMWHHKSNCNNVNGEKYNRKVYSFIRNNGGWQKWRYHIIEQFDVYDKIKLKEREDYWIVELKSTLNSYRADRNNKKYKQEHKEEIKKWYKKYNKNYQEDNKAKLSAPNVCECGGVYSYQHKARHFKSKRCLKYMASIISPSAPPSL